MSWEDRDYNRDEDAGGPSLGRGRLYRVFQCVNASVPLGEYFHVHVRLHVSFLLMLLLETLTTHNMVWTLRWSILLFFSVLLHELGHCLACRSVGGEADEVLMWPLGGLAFCAAPRRAWPQVITVLGGPIVTLLLTLLPLGLLTLVYRAPALVGFNPLALWAAGGVPGTMGLLHDLYMVNYTLLLFNTLLVFYPFDSGKLLQVGLWKLVGYERSMRWATAIGMAGAGAVAVCGVTIWEPLLVLIAVFVFLACYQETRAVAQDAALGPSFDPGYYDRRTRDPRTGALARWRRKRQAQRTLRQRQTLIQEEARVDAILAKVKAQGMSSLGDAEKKILHRATQRYQKTR